MAAATVEKKRMFNAVFKLKIIDNALQYSNKVAVWMHGIDEKRVCQWKKHKKDLEKFPAKKQQLHGASRKAALPDVEELLILWIDEVRAENLCVTCSAVQCSA